MDAAKWQVAFGRFLAEVRNGDRYVGCDYCGYIIDSSANFMLQQRGYK